VTWSMAGKTTATVLTVFVVWAVLRIFLLVVGVEWMEWVYEQIIGVVILMVILAWIWR
jgi:hypothetical protein